MTGPKAFIDTNILIYVLSADNKKADKAEEILRKGGLISVQVLNETANVARRKLSMPWPEIDDILTVIKSLCPVAPLTIETHDKGMAVAARYGFGVYDAMIIASAIQEGCDTLYSEDMQDGMLIAEQLRIRNPFTS